MVKDSADRDDVLIHPARLTAGERRELAQLRRTIRGGGWALSRGCAEIAGRHTEVRYTVGLTRHHGHPEFVVAGPPVPRERDVVDGLAQQVVEGRDLEPCWVTFGDRQFALVEVQSPQILWLAHLVYGVEGHPVQALQIVSPDARGRWPWQGGNGVLLGNWPFA